MTEKISARMGWTGTILLALLPLAFALRAGFSRVPIALAFLWGVYLLARHAKLRRIVRSARTVLAVCLLLLAYAIANILGHGLGWHALDLPSQVLLFVVISVLFALPLRARLVWFGFSTTAVILGVASAIQHYVMGAQRSYGLNGGHWSAIEFAMLLLVLSLLALSQALDDRNGAWLRCWHSVCAAAGIVGATLTQSRGPLMAMILAALLLAWLHARSVRRARGSVLMLTGTFLVLLATGLSLHGTFVQRFERGGHQAVDYASASSSVAAVQHGAAAQHPPSTQADVAHQPLAHAPPAHGSVPERLEMWNVAWHGFVTHPLFGIGIGRFGAYSRARIAAGTASRSIAQYDHPHNEYLEAAVTGGVPGLLVLLLVFLVPLVWFGRHALDRQFDVALVARGGLLVVLMYMLCALTDNVFYRAMPHSLYFFLVTGFAVWLARHLHDRGGERVEPDAAA